ncbi:MAG: purine-nucleoside phosphorylase [Thermodesulfobacteriota bacterium]|jgi:purine-nucleoside phosphorylase|nr:MAG: purine-nucleoside phosphorylase [Thermodesulfobacteriota bacterium]
MRENSKAALHEATAFLERKIPFTPSTGIILGTGLSSLGETIAVKTSIPYQEIPFFPVSTVESHTGNLVFGLWKEHEVVVLEGRVHYYEGYTLQEVTFPIRIMRALGISTLVITNAAGGLDPGFSAGELMVITDHINLIGDNPLRGPNAESLGDRFPSMHESYCPQLIQKTEDAARERGIVLRKGVYVAVPGPSLETPAETRFLRMIGADAVGMSTVPEVIVAVHAGIKVLGLSIIANVNRPETLAPAPLEGVIAVVKKAKPNLVNLLEGFLDRL